MSRYDKYDPKSGGFRAPLNLAWTATSGPSGVSDLWRVTCVALNGSGRLIRATTPVSTVGIVVIHGPKGAGDIVDVMTDGEVIELDALDLQTGSPAAGTKYYMDTTAGRLTTTAPIATAIGYYVGTTVEAGRLVVRAGLAGAL